MLATSLFNGEKFMKIATFNVNSIRARLPIFTKWLIDAQPDIVCLQETKATDSDFPSQAFADSGYEYVFHGQKSYNGVAIFSKTPISDVETDFDSDQARFIKAKINDITIVNTYIPQGESLDSDKFQYKLDWLAKLADYFADNFQPTDKIIWTSDLNLALLPIDVFNPETRKNHVCYHKTVRDIVLRILDWGFTDVFRLHCQEPDQYSFWDYRSKSSLSNNRGWRLDYIMATEPLAKRATGCIIDKHPRLSKRPSDHTPVIAEFDI